MPNQLLYKHWRTVKKEKDMWMRTVWVKVLESRSRPQQPFDRAKLRLERHSSVQPDFDGLAGSFKYVVDGLIKAGVLANDTMDVIGTPEYKWVKCKPKEGKIKVSVRPLKPRVGPH